MPGRDGTGPESKGPKTGRGLGPCQPDESGEKLRTEIEQETQFQPRRGGGRGMGRGGGRGRGRGLGRNR